MIVMVNLLSSFMSMLVVALLLSMVAKILAHIRTYVRVRALDAWHVSIPMLG